MKAFRFACMTLFAAAFCASTAVSAFPEYKPGTEQILVYTRTAEPNSYPDGLARSVHFARSVDGKHFTAMNENYGILFAKGTLSEQNTIRPKCVKNPVIFPLKDGGYGIMAIRTNENGTPDEESKGKVLLWTTKDLIHFSEQVLFDMNSQNQVKYIEDVSFDSEKNVYSILWAAESSGAYITTTADFSAPGKTSGPIVGRERVKPPKIQGPEGIVLNEPGYYSTVSVPRALADRAALHWGHLVSVAARVPENVLAASADDLAKVKAEIVYSDGSTSVKPVKWDASGVDFSKPGKYEITGTVQNESYGFPLARAWGDPVIFKWDGKFYFIATTDARNNIGLYVREADNPHDLFAEGVKEHLILDRDESRQLIQTFWAPEFHVIGDDLYILFAVGGRAWGPQCHYMKLKKGASIIDPASWEDPVKILKADGKGVGDGGISLDMTYIKAGGKSYYVWSYRVGIGSPRDTGSMLYIGTIDEKNPGVLTSEPVLLSRPLYGWENVRGTINNEGPYSFNANGKVYLTFSGGDAGGYTYALGLLTADENADLLDLKSWTKSNAPVLSFYSVPNKWGPGHNSFFMDDFGNLMIAYHGETSLRARERCVAIHRVHFNVDGEPVFNMSAERDLDPALAQVKTTVVTPGAENLLNPAAQGAPETPAGRPGRRRQPQRQ
jgi:GH43 family beta-xylosidase